MSRLEVQSAPLYVAKRTDPIEMSEDFYRRAEGLTQGDLSRHTLSTIAERLDITDEAEILGWLHAATRQKLGSLWSRWGISEVAKSIRYMVTHGVPSDYVLGVANQYDLIQDQLRIAQLFVYKVPAEYAAVASVDPWTVYSTHMMWEAGVPAEYTQGWNAPRNERVSDLSLVNLYEHSVPHEYALAHARTLTPMRAAALWASGVPTEYIRRIERNGPLDADGIILMHAAEVDADAAARLLSEGLSAGGVVLVLRDGMPVEYARAVA